MARIDDPTIYNPFGWRLSDLADPTTAPHQRAVLREELLIWEAEEAAHGYRHLTIVHGDPADIAASRHLSDFYDTVRDLTARADGWTRVRGDVGFLSMTVHGDDSDARIADFAAAAEAADPGSWSITATAFPPFS